MTCQHRRSGSRSPFALGMSRFRIYRRSAIAFIQQASAEHFPPNVGNGARGQSMVSAKRTFAATRGTLAGDILWLAVIAGVLAIIMVN